MQYNLYALLLVVIFSSCGDKIEKDMALNLSDIPKDTIQIPKNIKIDVSCIDQIKGYKNRYGIVFSNYYRNESLSVDFDGNQTQDSITILKPFYGNSIDDCYPENAEYDFPILLISKTINNKSKFFKIYKDILKNNEANYYEEIYIRNNGFIISKDYNGNNGFFSKTFVSYKEPNFYVDSINVESWGEYQYKKTLKFKNETLEFSKYKRTDIDSIRAVLSR
jgi:hypothetical protein